ncbi:MAG: purine-nucleoside phosphorylase [Clostridia bacterium]|nr:purine-nucleoside phosphorylase [Clostridia bacterium]
MACLEKATAYVRERLQQAGKTVPNVALVLGSGLGYLADELTDAVRIPYEEIPHFPHSTVASHAGFLAVGNLNRVPVLLCSGRTHYYEGYTFETVTFYVRVLKALGVDTLVLTNAAGGVNTSFSVGDLMLITDHIKLCADSPVRGPSDERLGARFFDMTHTYTPRLQAIAREAAQTLSVPLKEGVYFFMGGPQFETPAEIRMIRLLGGDAVGMSTVPEAIVAAQCGLQLLGISCITNMAAGMVAGTEVSDDEVVVAAGAASHTFGELMKLIVAKAATA